MLKKEYLARSPIRILEKSTRGGLGKGNLGVFTSRKGVGKTGSLVHVALDSMLRGEQVLHVSFNENPNHILGWYEIVYKELKKTYKLHNIGIDYDEIKRNRIVMNFNQDKISVPDVKKSIDAMAEHGNFVPSLIIVDGFKFFQAQNSDFDAFKSIAQAKDVEMWFSATLHRDHMDLDEKGIPAPVNKFTDYFSIIIMLDPQKDYIDLKLLKDNGSTDLEKLRLKLNPQTLLIANRRV